MSAPFAAVLTVVDTVVNTEVIMTLIEIVPLR
jgi:hypothetical protein